MGRVSGDSFDAALRSRSPNSRPRPASSHAGGDRSRSPSASLRGSASRSPRRSKDRGLDPGMRGSNESMSGAIGTLSSSHSQMKLVVSQETAILKPHNFDFGYASAGVADWHYEVKP